IDEGISGVVHHVSCSSRGVFHSSEGRVADGLFGVVELRLEHCLGFLHLLLKLVGQLAAFEAPLEGLDLRDDFRSGRLDASAQLLGFVSTRLAARAALHRFRSGHCHLSLSLAQKAFSFTVSTVSRGVTSSLRSARLATRTRPPPIPTSTAPMISAESHIGRAAARPMTAAATSASSPA